MKHLPTSRLQTVPVVQGQSFATNLADVEYSTILGSCVSMCMFDARSRVGGMNHFLLSGENHSSNQNLRYGLHAFEQLLNSLIKLGAGRYSLKAKIFGGASSVGFGLDLGRRNHEFAKEILEAEGIDIVSSHLGGSHARKLRFRPSTGEAHMKLVPQLDVFGDELAKQASPKQQSSMSTLF